MARKVTDTNIVTNKVRLSYVNLLRPRTNDKGEEKYDVCILVPKSDKETLDLIKSAIEAAKAEWKSKFGKLPPQLKQPLRDGDTERDTDEQPEYKGHYFFNATSQKKPGVVDRHTNILTDETEVYSGMYARVSVNFYPYSNESKGIAAGLKNVQKLADGEPLGGSFQKPEDVFSDDLEDEDDDWMN